MGRSPWVVQRGGTVHVTPGSALSVPPPASAPGMPGALALVSPPACGAGAGGAACFFGQATNARTATPMMNRNAIARIDMLARPSLENPPARETGIARA